MNHFSNLPLFFGMLAVGYGAIGFLLLNWICRRSLGLAVSQLKITGPRHVFGLVQCWLTICILAMPYLAYYWFFNKKQYAKVWVDMENYFNSNSRRDRV